jgi:methyl-accepting chemotaxis protein
MEEGNLEVDIDSERIDAIGRLYDGFAEMRDALREQIQEAEQARKEAEVSRAEAMEMNNYLQEKAEEYSETMQACSRGDLTRRMEPEGENDAMDQIAEDFNDMIGELEMTTGQLKTFAVEVEEGGRGVQQSAETVRDASEQVADSVQKISDDAYDQKERLQTISEEMDAIATQLEDFAEENPDVDFGDSLETIRQIAEMVGEAVELGEETMAESENVAGAAEEQAAELNEVSSRAEELVRYAQYLGDGLSNFETEEEHEFVFQTGAGSTGPAGDEVAETDDSEPDDE